MVQTGRAEYGKLRFASIDLGLARLAPLIVWACTAMAVPVYGWTEPVTTAKRTGPNQTIPKQLGPRRGVVASVNPRATDAGLNALRRGGNAIDAAIATALTLGVVDGHNSGIGGGCFILIRRADGSLIAIDGREMAPAKATRDMYLRDGKGQTQLSQMGSLACGVPGALAAYKMALAKAGSLPMSDLIRPAAKLAGEGFPIDRVYASKLAAKQEQLRQFAGTRKVLMRPDGSPWKQGDVLVQSDLAKTYRSIGQHGIDWFYRGPFAEKLEAWMKKNGGIMTAKDLANYRAQQRTPIKTSYRGHTIIGFPPPSSGGVHVAQMLHMLEGYDLRGQFAKKRSAGIHLLTEVMQRAFADRTHWLGDADFAKVPKGLVHKDYAKRLARTIRLDRVSTVTSHGDPLAFSHEMFGKHTTHIAAADDEGNWVAMTQTINTTFGSKVIIPGTGVIMNNEMDDFSVQPGVPNSYGLLGAEANAIAPGKRPLSSMSPTIILRDGEPVMAVGAAGGPKIITQVLLAIVYRLDLKLPLKDVLGLPRFHHQWKPARLFVEATTSKKTISELEKLGHQVQKLNAVGITQAVIRTADGKLLGGHDPRVPGKAASVLLKKRPAPKLKAQRR